MDEQSVRSMAERVPRVEYGCLGCLTGRGLWMLEAVGRLCYLVGLFGGGDRGKIEKDFGDILRNFEQW